MLSLPTTVSSLFQEIVETGKMMWSRTRKLCILVPLLIVWILFQLSYYNRRLTKQHKISNVKSFDDARKSIIHTNRDWSPPDIVNTNYDYDFPIFLEGKEKSVADKFWFMNNGNVRPEQFKIDVKSKLWPEQCSEDRIIEQLMYIPSNYSNGWSFSSITKIDIASLRENKLKKVLLIGDFDRMDYPPGRKIFFHDKCPVNTCTLARTTEEARNADVVIFKGHYVEGIDLFVRRQPHHVWILYLLESPANFKELGKANNLINWTASYRHDSDIVTPYGKFVPYSKMSSYIPGDLKLSPRSVNYAANKTKKVAWFVSNCNAKNDRLQYAESLSQHIDVDIFGECGTKKCPQFLHSQCLKMLDTDYKFYLSFENSNCKEYITEKFFKIGLG